MTDDKHNYYWFTQVATEPFSSTDIEHAAVRKVEPATLIKHWRKRNGEHFYVWKVLKTVSQIEI